MEKRRIDYARLLGATPADWFMSTQDRSSTDSGAMGAARKGSLAHFLHCFPEDASLTALRSNISAADRGA